MFKFLLIGVLVTGAGALGYFGERFFRPTKAPMPKPEQVAMAAKAPLLFKLPLGKFTMQIIQRSNTLHLLFDIDVYIAGAATFQNINGAVGRAMLRDAVITAIAELAETDQTLAEEMEEDQRKTELAAKIVRKLYVDFPMIKTARVNGFQSNMSLRE